jgi:hypothetical protein
MDPNVWGPHYWFFLHSVALHYPKLPNATTKKIHYRLIHNFHEFIPHRDIAANFTKLLARYPVAPYLDSRTHFVRWVHFLHNKVNEIVHKPTITLEAHRANMKQRYAETKRVNLSISILFAVLLALVIYTCYE